MAHRPLIAAAFLCALPIECVTGVVSPFDFAESLDKLRELTENNFGHRGNNPSYIENEIESSEKVTFTNHGKNGEDIKQVYHYVVSKIDALEERVTGVEESISDISNRLSRVDCSDLPSSSVSGVFDLYLDHRGTRTVSSFCDMDTDDGGWTVILRRIPHENARTALNFTRSLREYKIGFGEPTGDFWVGLQNVHEWTKFRDYRLRIQLTDFKDEEGFAVYDHFYVEGEQEGFKLGISGYSGDIGDSLSNHGNSDNFTADGMLFSTYDEDRDTSHEINCSSFWGIGGWWFNRCSWANLMGPYRLPGSGDGIGINWHKWRNKEYIKAVTMMIKPAQ